MAQLKTTAVNGRLTSLSLAQIAGEGMFSDITSFSYKANADISILDLPIRQYNIDYLDNDNHEIGCLPDDLERVCPYLIKMDDITGLRTIQESKIVYLLIEEVKALKTEVDELKQGLEDNGII